MRTSAETQTKSWTSFGVIFVCFFLSGATGLIYQVIWLRLLGLVFGHTVYAITTVLAAFMGGLALGSFVFARYAARIQDLIRAYGWLEIGIGVYCALLPLLFMLVSYLYLGLHHMLGFSYDAFSLIQFLLIFALLLVPTTMMGGTLPVLSQALVEDDAGLGRKVGTLYAVNTTGAVLGVVLAGYLLLPWLGNRVTIGIAALANVTVGVLAILYSKRRQAAGVQTAQPPMGPRAARDAGSVSPSRAAGALVWLTVAALGVSGASSMIYEVAWTRALALVVGSSTYAFTSMLVAFLVGIAGGSALYSWFLGARRALPGTFAALQVGIAVSFALVLLNFERMPELFLMALRWSDSPMFIQLVQFLVSASSLLVSTLLIGATFPCAVAVAARAARVGQDVGYVYAVNTVGAIVGTIAAGFVLIPALGVHGSIKVGIVVNLLVGATLLGATWCRTAAWRWGSIGAILAVAIGVLLIPPWDQRVMSAGPAVYGKWYLDAGQRATLKDILRRQKVLFYRDGRSGTISVNQEGQHIFLRTNGKMDAGTAVDMPTQLMSGHLPLLIHPDPRQVLVIGLGSGITVGAVARHPVEHLDVVEIEPAVVEASQFFASIHGNVLKDPRVQTVIADGRNFLLTTAKRYDVIISEPSNPWISGLAALFSHEFFEMAREHLEPDGIMLQWMQGYNLNPDDMRMVVKTFGSVFPAVSIWNTIRGDYLLMGRVQPTPIDLNLIQGRFQGNPGVWRDLDRFGIKSWPGVLGYFMLGEADAVRLSDGAGINTDDKLPLEFNAPRALYFDTVARNWELIRSFKVADLPEVTPESQRQLEQAEVQYWIGLGYALREVYPDALAHFLRAMELDPSHTSSMLEAAVAYIRMGQPSAALEFARRVLDPEPRNANAFYLAGLASEALKSRTQAVDFLQRAVALEPQNAEFQAALRRVTGNSSMQ